MKNCECHQFYWTKQIPIKYARQLKINSLYLAFTYLTLTPLNKNLDTTPVLLNTISPSGHLQLNYFIDTDMYSKSCISFELLNLEQKIMLSK